MIKRKPEHLKNIDTEKTNWKEKDANFWKQNLPKNVYQVCRLKGTEHAFTGIYNNFHEAGIYSCFCCGQELFSSDNKFNSGTGWPSFTQPINSTTIMHQGDNSLESCSRTEVLCSRCEAHLGHVFNDSPPPSSKRYCINSMCLFFEPKE